MMSMSKPFHSISRILRHRLYTTARIHFNEFAFERERSSWPSPPSPRSFFELYFTAIGSFDNFYLIAR